MWGSDVLETLQESTACEKSNYEGAKGRPVGGRSGDRETLPAQSARMYVVFLGTRLEQGEKEK